MSTVHTFRCFLCRCTAAADGVACTGAVLALSSVVVRQVVSSVKAETRLPALEPQMGVKGQQGPFATYITPLSELQLFFAVSVDHSALTICYHESLPRWSAGLGEGHGGGGPPCASVFWSSQLLCY